MVRYEGVVVRPPSEAQSLILQATLGCSHNKCIFCGTYLDKGFRARPLKELFEDIDSVGDYAFSVRRVFLADGNALVLSTDRLLKILDKLNDSFPRLVRVGIYGNASDILRKSPEDLEELRKRKLGIIYLGLESGSDEILQFIEKGATSQEMIEAVKKAQAVGIDLSVIAILGIGGRGLSEHHARETARVLNEMNPRYASFLTLMVIPGTPLHDMVRAGEFDLLDPLEMLRELRIIVENLDLEGTIFRTNHASNYLALGGTFPQDKGKILREIERGLSGEVPLRPEFLRAL
ncbi:MAG: radical SAM protein [Anaerolineae bacterium]